MNRIFFLFGLLICVLQNQSLHASSDYRPVWQLIETAQSLSSQKNPSKPEAWLPYIEPQHHDIFLKVWQWAHDLRLDFSKFPQAVDEFQQATGFRIISRHFRSLVDDSVYLDIENGEVWYSAGFDLVHTQRPDLNHMKEPGSFSFYFHRRKPHPLTPFSFDFDQYGRLLSASLHHENSPLGSKLRELHFEEGDNIPDDVHYYSAPPVLDVNEIYATPVEASEAVIRVAVLDQGIDYNHPFLARHIPRTLINDTLQIIGEDLTEIYPFPMDCARDPYEHHGTAVAGQIVEGHPSWLQILPYRVYDPEDIPRAAQAAVAAGARVIQMSLEVNDSLITEAWIAEFTALVKAHPEVLFVTAAGNDSQNLDEKPRYPASITAPNLINVGSLNEKDALSIFNPIWETGSNFGKKSVHFFAEGEEQWTSIPGGLFAKVTGTSYAAPTLSKYAAWILNAKPELLGEEVVEVLKNYVVFSEALEAYGQYPGRINETQLIQDFDPF